MKLIKNVKIVLKNSIVEGSLLFSDRIERIIYKNCDSNLENIEEGEQTVGVIDGDGYYLAPGFIDIHIHGAAGYDTMDGSNEALDKIKMSLIKSGVTSFLATTMSMPVKDIKKALAAIRSDMDNENRYGARILGCHLEGPFLNREYKGAQAAKDIISPDIEPFKEYIDIVKIATVAPEIKGAGKLVRYLKENDIIVSAGHTGASYEEILSAREWGLSHTTHLFNAMTKLHHREPGLIGAALTTDMSCELIADFIHIHPAVLNLVFQAKNLAQLILVTDQMRAGSLSDGEYELGGQKVIVKDGSARLEEGSLAGSVLRLDQAIRNIKGITDLEIYEIINMVTYNPARLLGMEEEIGSIKEGNRADFVLLNDKLEVREVYKDGEKQLLET